jgi:hypothetical protein
LGAARAAAEARPAEPTHRLRRRRRLREGEKRRKKKNPGTAYVAFLPLISPDGFRATLSGHALDAKTAREQSGEGGDGRPLCLVAESGDAATTCSKADSILCVAVASSPFEACGGGRGGRVATHTTFGLRVDKVVPPTAEVFGWCTWDAFYHSVTPAGVEAGVASLASGGTPARFVIVDDGWQSVTPDAAYRKKVDHISDHPPGSPFRSADAARRSRDPPRFPPPRARAICFKRPKRNVRPFCRSVDAFGVSGVGRLPARRRTRRPRLRRARPPRATTFSTPTGKHPETK